MRLEYKEEAAVLVERMVSLYARFGYPWKDTREGYDALTTLEELLAHAAREHVLPALQ